MSQIKVKIVGENHSVGRGIGFYREHLVKSLTNIRDISIVDDSPDLVHYPFFDPFYHTLPDQFSTPTVVTVHDLTPLVLPKHYPVGLKGRIALYQQKLSLKKVSAIITDSQASKNDIVRLFGVDSAKIHVVYLAVADEYSVIPQADEYQEIKKRYQLPDKFILYVGGVNPNKNVSNLAKVCLELEVPLVLVGSEFTKVPKETFSLKKLLGFQRIHPELRDLMVIKEILARSNLIRSLGYVSNKDLNAIYRMATVYCQPSLYEGFGLPVLEAMTAGCPLVCSDRGSLPEIYPPGTDTFDPNNLVQMKTAIIKTFHLDPATRKNLVIEGQKKANQFSWGRSAEITKGVYLSILNNK